MRPIVRGDPPQMAGFEPEIPTYRKFAAPLEERVGPYCAYCEMRLNEGIKLDHVRPKSVDPHLALDWLNLLPSCVFCNSIKGSQPVDPLNYLWPHRDNSFLAFLYEPDRVPRVNPNLETSRDRAQNTLSLFKLDLEPRHHCDGSLDRRLRQRIETWRKAQDAKSDLTQCPSDGMRRSIVNTATSTGFWSVWMTVFADEPVMRQRFIDAFPGTCTSCFNSKTEPNPRAGGFC